MKSSYSEGKKIHSATLKNIFNLQV